MYHLYNKVFLSYTSWSNVKIHQDHNKFIGALLKEMWGNNLWKKSLQVSRTKKAVPEIFTPKKFKAFESWYLL